MLGHFARNCFTRTRTQSQNRANFPRRFTPNFRKNQRRGNQRNQQPRVRFQDQNTNRYAQNRYQNDFEYGQRVTNNARYLNRLDPTGRYTDTGYQEYESNANQGHDYQDEYCCDIGQIDRLFKIELFPLSSCQVIILIARMTFNCSTSCLMS